MTTTALERRLGPVDAAIVVANAGVGIFTTPMVVAAIVPNPRAVLGGWAAGGVLAFLGALAYALRSSSTPSSPRQGRRWLVPP